MIDVQHLVAVVQSTAIAYGAWRGDINVFSDVIYKACGFEFNQTDLDELKALLRGPQLRGFLFSRDVRLWIGNDNMLRLVDQQPSSLRAAKLRLAHNPGPTSCRYCLLTESNRTPELAQEKDANGHFIAGSFVHAECANAWRRLRLQVAAAGVNENV